MKRLYFWLFMPLLLVLAASWAVIQPTTAPDARVKRNMGVGIFIQCRPIRAFDTLYTFTTNKKLESFPGPSAPNVVKGIGPAIDDLTYQALAINKKVARKKRKNKKTKWQHIDAIISDDAVTAIAVKWKNASTVNDYDQAFIQPQNGTTLYIRNEPVQAYTKLFEVKIRHRLDLNFTGYGNLTVMLNTLTSEIKRTADSLQQTPTGFITDNGYSGWAIAIKK